MYKVIYFGIVTGHGTIIPSSIKDGDNYFTYGWSGGCARKFKEFNPDVIVECWKTDHKAKTIYEREVSGVTFRIFPAYHIKHLGDYSSTLLTRLRKELKSGNKVIFNEASIRHLSFYSIALQLKNFPLVVQHHGESSAIHRSKMNTGLKKLFYAFQIPIERMCFKNIDAFFVVDKRIADYIPRNNKNIIIKFSTVGNDEKVFIPIDKKEAKRMLGWDEGKKHILYVGRLNYTKRSDILLKIYKELKEEGRNDIELVLAGNTKDDLLYDEAVQSGAILYPLILQTELYKYLSAADVYCLPKYAEEHTFAGVGTLPIEALFCETPIIGDNLKSFPEEDREKIGFNCNNKNQIKLNILKILDGQIIFKDLRKIALKHYSWENISKRTCELYLKILSKYNSNF